MEKKYLNFSIKKSLQLDCEEHLAESAVSLTEKQKLSLYKKSQKSGIDTGVLEEVYRRGYLIWKPDLFEGTREQFAFDRVNSFISGGFAADIDEDLLDIEEASKEYLKQGRLFLKAKRAREKAAKNPTPKISQNDVDDLVAQYLAKGGKIRKEELELEEKKGLWDNIHAKRRRGERMRKPGEKGAPTDAAFKASQNEEADPCWDGYKQIGMKTKKGKKVPNCVPVKEENYEVPTTNPDLSSSRFQGTDELVNIYKAMTPGQEPKPKSKLVVIIKKTVKENLEEATYKGKTVKLNKPFRTPGGPKKSAVYVDPDGDGKAKIVRFGDPNLSIKKNQPGRKKSYCARSSGQGNLNKKDSANYWSRKAWDC